METESLDQTNTLGKSLYIKKLGFMTDSRMTM